MAQAIFSVHFASTILYWQVNVQINTFGNGICNEIVHNETMKVSLKETLLPVTNDFTLDP